MADEQVHHPDMMPAPEPEKQNGLMCWLNMERPCGADCMAYVDPPLVKGPDYEGKQWANCIILASLHQESKHVAVLAQLLRQTRVPAPPKTSLG